MNILFPVRSSHPNTNVPYSVVLTFNSALKFERWESSQTSSTFIISNSNNPGAETQLPRLSDNINRLMAKLKLSNFLVQEFSSFHAT